VHVQVLIQAIMATEQEDIIMFPMIIIITDITIIIIEALIWEGLIEGFKRQAFGLGNKVKNRIDLFCELSM